MTPSLALGLLLAVAAAAERLARRSSGTVLYTTAGRLYLDAGARDGLTPGQVIDLRGGGRSSGTCKVEQVADDRATCAGTGTVGATFALSPPPPSAPEPVVRPASPAAPEVVARQREAVLQSAFEKVDARPDGAAGFGTRGVSRVAAVHTTYAATGVGPWHEERVDASLRGLPLAGGFALDADLSARRWTLRSGPVSFRPEDPTQLYIWEAALSRRGKGDALAVSLGRVRPRSVPGATILDGAQAGWRTAGGTEAGLFGGLVPDEVTLAPTLQHGTVGAYWTGSYTGAPASPMRLFRHELRAAFVQTAELGRRIEGEALAQLWLGRALDVSGQVRVAGGDHQSPGDLDAVRIDANARPIESLTVTGGFRYDGLRVPELDGSSILLGGSGRHADLSAAWAPAAWIRLSVLSGLSTDLVSSLSRRYAGPEIGFPRLFGDAAGIAIGYVEESGWSSGRSGWLEFLLRSRGTFQCLARLSWFHTAGQGPSDTDDLGAYASASAQLGRFVALRVSALARRSLNGRASLSGAGIANAGSLDVGLAGQF